LNFFSTAMRILFEHMMGTSAPEDQVVKAPWFRVERPDGKASRWQRVVFAIQGGLADAFVKDELKVDLPPLRNQLLDTVNKLSKHVHGRENTIIRDQSAQHDVIERTMGAMEAIVDSLHAWRNAVLAPIAEALDRAAVDSQRDDVNSERCGGHGRGFLRGRRRRSHGRCFCWRRTRRGACGRGLVRRCPAGQRDKHVFVIFDPSPGCFLHTARVGIRWNTCSDIRC